MKLRDLFKKKKQKNKIRLQSSARSYRHVQGREYFLHEHGGVVQVFFGSLCQRDYPVGEDAWREFLDVVGRCVLATRDEGMGLGGAVKGHGAAGAHAESY